MLGEVGLGAARKVMWRTQYSFEVEIISIIQSGGNHG
jgi:hypothetical protein